jgi:NAD(P)-dependent dehydrogenase (short-subunit alcohol dehydrogenase family)
MISGVTGGVGREVARLARRAGWNVVGIYHRNGAEAGTLVGELASGPGWLKLEACDLTDSDAVRRLVGGLRNDCGPDALVHLAAPRLDVRPLHQLAWEDFERQISGGVKSAVALTQGLLRRMTRRGGARIVFALSTVLHGNPPRGFAAYTVAKAAVAAYARCLSKEYAGRGLTVNTVSPGPMRTDLLADLPSLLVDQIVKAAPGGNWIPPLSVARTIFWLISEASAEIDGCDIPVATAPRPMMEKSCP